MLDVQHLNLRYGQSQILFDVALQAVTGKITALMGNNGARKTSLLKAIAGRHTAFDGDITIGGEPAGKANAYQAARNGVAYVAQGREGFPMLSVQ